MLKHKIFIFLIISLFTSFNTGAQNFEDTAPQVFYVDGKLGSDYNDGSLAAPFRTLQKALQVVDIRVNNNILSDTIFVRGGIYPHNSTETLYHLNLKGTRENRAVLSAMPAKAGAPGAVQMKSGKWYEKVVFDDSWEIKSVWIPVPGKENLWQTKPGFFMNEWPYTKMRWRYNGMETPETVNDVEMHSLAPYMILQNNEPLLWANSPEEITKPGYRTFDFSTQILYVRTTNNEDPNNCRFTSWYGGPDKNGHLLRDGEGRALFDGNLEYATICGFEFNMLTRIFEFHRRGYVSENDRVQQHFFRFEDNVTRYCFINLLLDSNTTLSEQKNDGLIPPRFNDRSNWEVRNNVFYRPVKECFQVHGDNHVFEYNEIIEHAGPWGGPASRVGAVNARNMRNVIIRGNYIQGNGPNPDTGPSVFMIEASGASHADSVGDYRFGNIIYEYNLFANITNGVAIVAGKGGIRMKNITIRNNIFLSSGRDATILLSSPHQNLVIENNIFYNLKAPISIKIPENSNMEFNAKPSVISVKNNIFMKNEKTIDSLLLHAHPESKIVIEKNIFHQNKLPGLGEKQINKNPGLADPENYNFYFTDNKNSLKPESGIGIYDKRGNVNPQVNWKLIREKQLQNFPGLDVGNH